MMSKCQVCGAAIPDGLTYCPPKTMIENEGVIGLPTVIVEYGGCEVLKLKRYGSQPPVRNAHFQKGGRDGVEGGRKSVSLTCLECGEEFSRVCMGGSRPKYCGDECRRAARRKIYTARCHPDKKPAEIRNCGWCGSPVLLPPAQRRFCGEACARGRKTQIERERRMALR